MMRLGRAAGAGVAAADMARVWPREAALRWPPLPAVAMASAKRSERNRGN